jgi:hypothetical protein
MHIELRRFLTQLMGVVVMSLVPVVFTAFLTMPWSLGRHPGEAVPLGTIELRHMT